MNPTPHSEAAFSLRPAQDADAEALFRVYASTRTEELAKVPWDDGRKDAFLRMQFEAQTRCYRSDYPGAVFDVILVRGAIAGRLSVHRRAQEIRVMDIALLPEHRRRGIGGRILRGILQEAERDAKHVTIHVESFNPAQHLYERLGFQRVGSNGAHHLMEYRPAALVEARS
ncbi:MAG: GNAT family N-acetyltransferase [Verrucomicrobia bacterium]|nr:GNAT family N-acetyltransferase [Verrucomicrobiota bacterium]MBI3868733.1 GNAT family N-acetyltransferase [Verrucomicrobiota bacterium]